MNSRVYYVDRFNVVDNEFDNLNNKINKLTKDIDKLKKRSNMNFRKRNKRIKIKY